MKPLLLALLVIILNVFPAGAAPVKKAHANPINIACRLALDTDSAKIASMLEYYGYSSQPSENGFIVYKHIDGTVIRYTLPETDSKQSFPIVQVDSKVAEKEVESILEELKFHKVGDSYENISSQYSNYVTKCSFGPGKPVVFQRLKK